MVFKEYLFSYRDDIDIIEKLSSASFITYQDLEICFKAILVFIVRYFFDKSEHSNHLQFCLNSLKGDTKAAF